MVSGIRDQDGDGGGTGSTEKCDGNTHVVSLSLLLYGEPC